MARGLLYRAAMDRPAPPPSPLAPAPETLPRVMVVDDEKGPRESLRMILSPGHEVLLAESGAEALDLLATAPVDLMTVDLNMPGMRGDELMRIVRERHPEVEVIIITGFGDLETAVQGIRYGVRDYLQKPFDVVQVTAAVVRALERGRSRRRLVRFLEGVGRVLGAEASADEAILAVGTDAVARHRLRALLAEPALDPNESRAPLADRGTIEFLEILAESIESRDPAMRGHGRRVADYCGLLAEQLCLSAREREQLRIAAFLHDLGKVGIPPAVLPPDRRLEPAERAEVQLHAGIGERLVRPLGFCSSIASAIRHHHERWDGAGYPDGQQGDEIPLMSRIIAIADAYDAMVIDRTYEPALTHAAALAELCKEAGGQFDPMLVRAFLTVVRDGVELPDGAGGHTR